MKSLELTIAELQNLPPASRARAVDFVRQLHAATRAERLQALQATAGCLSPEEVKIFEKAIREFCEQTEEAG